MADEPAILDFVAGELRVRHWPAAAGQPPFGLRSTADGLRGPARLRGAALRALAAANLPCRDQLAPPLLPALPPPALDGQAASLFASWQHDARLGIACGLPQATRHRLVHAAVAALQRPALVVAPDTAAMALWRDGLRAHGVPCGEHPFANAAAVTVATAAGAARDIAWLGDRHELLTIDLPELISPRAIAAIADGSAATARLGFAGEASPRAMFDWSQALGPVFAVVASSAPAVVELRIALPPAARGLYDAAWHEFLGAYDRFAAAWPDAGFGAFVKHARADPHARPGLLAWHEALRHAAWNEGKAAIVAALLQRHRDQRVLVFTPDRASAYQLARAHLIAPITAEVPRRERQAAFAAFAAGELRALAGPRLLDAGVPEHTADVGIVAGGGHGRAQRAARGRRVALHGVLYELTGLDTVEVGRAHRWRGTAAGATAVVHGR